MYVKSCVHTFTSHVTATRDDSRAHIYINNCLYSSPVHYLSQNFTISFFFFFFIILSREFINTFKTFKIFTGDINSSVKKSRGASKKLTSAC